MIKLIKSMFVSAPEEKIKKERDRKYKQAVELQRNGRLREYAEIMKEIEELEDEYVRLTNPENKV